ncbi:MAG TPA: carboxypeptidase-like regulatory domain-containing protein, partial [Pyrinomonadaceae bacterium]
MTKQNFDVNNLRVASPCRVGWETMSGDERVRHCNLCRLNVYNLSEMTADEVRGLITKSEGRICGRLHKRADGTVITKNCPVGFRAYQKRAARMAGAALAAIIGLFSVSYGQQEDEKSADASKAKIVRTINRKNILSGSIKDVSGAIVPGAEVVIFKSDDGGEKLKVKSDDEGFYQTPLPAAGIYTLE